MVAQPPPAQRSYEFIASIPPDPLSRILGDAQRADRQYSDDADRVTDLVIRLGKRGDAYSQTLYRAIVGGDRDVGIALLEYSRLSAVQRARFRASLQTRRHRHRTDDRPPTDRQLNYLRRQGSAACPSTRREAAEVIREIVQECRTGRRGEGAAW